MTPYYEEGGCTIWHGDCIQVMGHLSERFELIVTSPPYNLGYNSGFGHYVDDAGFRSRGGGGKWTGGPLANGYTDHDDAMLPAEYEAWQLDVLTTCWGMLTDDGAIFYNHKPRVQEGELWTPLRVNPGLPIRQIVIWGRGGGMNFAPTHYVPTHEWIVVFAKPDWRLKSKGASGVGDVWYVPADTGNPHPAPFPVSIPARALETSGAQTVLDPFLGSGSTLVAAKAAGVRGVGIDKTEAYCEMAARRLQQTSLFEAETWQQDSLI